MTLVTKIRKLVRPYIAVSLVTATVVLFFIGKIVAREILPIVGLIIGFYFGERSALKNPDIPEGE